MSNANDPYCYPGTDVLINRPGFTDPAELQRFERTSTQRRAEDALAFAARARVLDQAVLCGIHRILFQDVYDWAGKNRTVDVAKGGLPFDPSRSIEGHADQHILPAFRKSMQQATTAELVAGALAECWGELNELHLFREGNGRATQIFITTLARRYGYDINWSCVARDAENRAAIASQDRNYGPYCIVLIGCLLVLHVASHSRIGPAMALPGAMRFSGGRGP